MKMLNYSTIKVEQVQTQNSEIKNRGVGVKHHGVCEKCSKQTENSTTNPKLQKKNHGICVKHHLVCVWNVRNKPKTRLQTQNLKKKS